MQKFNIYFSKQSSKNPKGLDEIINEILKEQRQKNKLWGINPVVLPSNEYVLHMPKIKELFRQVNIEDGIPCERVDILDKDVSIKVELKLDKLTIHSYSINATLYSPKYICWSVLSENEFICEDLLSHEILCLKRTNQTKVFVAQN